ncbi:HD-GYP domain-containing protein [Dechloromonas sp. ARDL1]|uniref:HD-GYP domain-containing protein n=1 Tax=Dechloromonas sp. ARDL1 TaxID=3322121 RepID=UPI003DA77FB1
MIRKISIDQLLPGMYVVDLHKRWLDHSIWIKRFKVRDEDHVWKLKDDGITEISIDTAKGIDLPPSPIARINAVEKRIRSLAEIKAEMPHTVSLGEERRRATKLLREASDTVTGLMLSAKAGHSVDAARLEPVVAKMLESVSRNPDALVPLARLKSEDTYATEHAVATAALIIAFGRQQGLAEPEIEKLALGTMVKDVGHAAIDARLITKPGMLSKAEFSIVQSHVEEGLAVLEATSRLSETSVAVVLEHHERYNGCGYPYRMAGDEISLAGRMAAIVDTYDAMTSARPYRAAMSPSHALRQLYEEGGKQYDPALVAAFVKTVGIYPVGTLVLLESGHLAVVEQLHPDNMLTPIVLVIYHTGRKQYLTTPAQVDLSRKVGNHYGQIVRAESYERWGISALRWQPA